MNENEIIDVNAEVPAIMDSELVTIADGAEKRVAAIRKIKQYAIAVTNQRDWIDQGGKPYLQVSGAEKIARVFGISWRIDEPSIHNDEDGHYSYTYKGYFRLGNTEIEAIGTRSSKDPFFSRKGGEDVPPSEVNRNNVKKSAYTNCLGNGITRLLGIRNMTWEELSGANIEKEKAGKVEYDKPEMTQQSQSKREEIRKMVLDMTNNDKTQAQEKLQEITSFIGKDGQTVKGKRTVDDLSEKAVPVTYGKVKKVYDEWKKVLGEGGITDEDGGFADEPADDHDQPE